MGFYERMPQIFAKSCDGSKGIKKEGKHGNDIVLMNDFK